MAGELQFTAQSILGAELHDMVNCLLELGATEDTVLRCVLARLVPEADDGKMELLLKGFSSASPLQS